MKKLQILNANTLKIIALVCMTIDHIGYYLCNNNSVMRGIGRIAFPIFAYMIAEGCKYTKNKNKYLLTIFGIGAVFQIWYTLTYRTLYMNVLLTFTFSIIAIYCYQIIDKTKKSTYLPFIIILPVIFIISVILPNIINNGFTIDYGFIGVIIPLAVYIAKSKRSKLIVLSICLILNTVDYRTLTYTPLKFLSLISVILIALYNGKKGKLNLKYLFYVYYPLHLVVIYFISQLR